MPAAILTAFAAVIQLVAGTLAYRTAKASAWRMPWTVITFGMFLASAASLYHLFSIYTNVSRGGSELLGELLYLLVSLIAATAVYTVNRTGDSRIAAASPGKGTGEELRQLLSALPDCVLHIDRKGIVKGVYPAHDHSFAAGGGDGIGRPFAQVLPSELVQTIQPELIKVLKSGAPRTFVTCAKFGNETKDLEIRLVPMGDGGVVMVVGDITQRVGAKEALGNSEARLSSIIKSLPLDFFSIDADGRYDQQNEACRNHWGEVVGKRPEDVAPNDEVRRLWVESNKRAFAGETVEGEVEYAFDGEKEYYYNIVTPIHQDGQITGILGVNIDVTERKQAEEAVRESEAKFKALVEESLVGVYLIQDQRIQYINPKIQEILGYDPKKMVGRSFLDDLIHPDDKAMVADNIHKRINGETQSIHYTFRLFARDSSIKHVEVYGTRTMYGGEPAIIGTMVDVTERTKEKQQRQRLRATLDRAEKMDAVGILAGGVAHELNNILGPVVAYPEIISKKLPADSPVKRQVDLIGKSAREAADIIKDLITLARRDHYEMVTTDLNNVIGTYLDSPDCEKFMVNNRRVVVEQHLNPHLPAISGCPTHLVKVVMNLFTNAVAAMPDGGTLTISTIHRQIAQLFSGYDKIESGEYIILKVSDTGTGMSEEDVKRIFEPYFTRKKNSARQSGLHLAVVYGIVKDHKGYYDVFSSIGEGTDFVLYFPVAPVAEGPAGSSIDDLTGCESVLIVDDSQELCEVAQEILESQGYRVAMANSGREAIAYFKQHSADLLVLDMIMEEDLDGLDTYREIVKLHANQKAIVVSAYSTNERICQLHQLGVGQFVKKPYSADTLARAVRNELDRQPAGSPT